MSTTQWTSTFGSVELSEPPPTPPPQPPAHKLQKGSAFYLSITAVVVTVFLSAMDLTAVSTALPTITNDLHGGDEFTWIGSAYALSSTAILPLTGCLADIFGRRPIMLLSVAFFAIGSALAGASQNMNMLVAARTVQGIGGGGILNLCSIIISDLVPLAERGIYQGVLGLVWALASGAGPPIGAVFAERATWRWLFYLNLPLAGISFALVAVFLKVRTPPGTIMGKLARVDWLGNLIIIAGTTLAVVGMTFGGIEHPWGSAPVLAPLIIGLLTIGGFILYEAKVPVEPTIPWEVLSNRTTLSAYVATFMHGIVSISVIYYLPVFFQASLGASPLRSSVDTLPQSTVISPFAMASGVTVQLASRYIPVNAVGWVIMMIGMGVMTLLKASSSEAEQVGYQILTAVGIGIEYSTTVFPVLAPQPVNHVAAALGFYAFVRSFAQTWGITISSTILQNELEKTLPAAFLAEFPGGTEIAYSAIPLINGLPEPLRTEVRVAFASSMAVVWKTMIGVAGAGLLSVFFLKEIPMVRHTDETFGLLDEKRHSPDDEKDVEAVTSHQ